MRNIYTIVITGHVDHGKSTLIGRLLLDTRSLPDERIRELEHLGRRMGEDAELAFLVDQLREERECLATYDTTQRRFRYRGREFAIIDTPGHAAFIRGMLTGATQADAAVLVIDAREGIQDQTRRHLAVLRLVGIRDIIVVVNKMDSVSYSRAVFDRITSQVKALCASEPVAIIPASCRDGDSIVRRSPRLTWYRGKTLAMVLATAARRPAATGSRLRFAVQDVYHIDGRDVCVGRVETGSVRCGMRMSALPSAARFSIRRLVFWPASRNTRGRQGENIGIDFAESPAPKRGTVMSEPREHIAPQREVRASVFWLADEPWRKSDSLVLRCATQTAGATLTALSQRLDTATLRVLPDTGDDLYQHEIGEADITLGAGLVMERLREVPGLARFTLERDGQVCGIGVIP